MNIKTPLYKILSKKYGRISFAQFLIAWRTNLELTQAEFAKKLALSPANLCDLEQGRRIPTPKRAKKIATKLGLPPQGLVAIAIEDSLYKAGMKYQVALKEAA